PELRAVGDDRGTQLVERLDRETAGVGGRLQHQRGDGADKHGLGHAPGAVAADVAGDLAAAGGMADVDRVRQVELLHELRQVIGVGIKVVAVPWLARAAVTAAIVGDAAVGARGQIEHMVLEGVAAEGPTVAEDDGLTLAPVLVIDLGAVLRGDRAHGVHSSLRLSRLAGQSLDMVTSQDADYPVRCDRWCMPVFWSCAPWPSRRTGRQPRMPTRAS